MTWHCAKASLLFFKVLQRTLKNNKNFRLCNLAHHVQWRDKKGLWPPLRGLTYCFNLIWRPRRPFKNNLPIRYYEDFVYFWGLDTGVSSTIIQKVSSTRWPLQFSIEKTLKINGILYFFSIHQNKGWALLNSSSWWTSMSQNPWRLYLFWLTGHSNWSVSRVDLYPKVWQILLNTINIIPILHESIIK